VITDEEYQLSNKLIEADPEERAFIIKQQPGLVSSINPIL